MKIVAAVQCRMGSTRLPGKVLREVNGPPMVGRIVRRLQACQEIDEVVVATTTDPADDRIVDYCQVGIGCERGPVAQIDQRLLEVAEARKADAIVRITGDCPLVDTRLVDGLVMAWRRWTGPPLDYASNVFPSRTYPDGLDIEILSREFLHRSVEAAFKETDWDHEALTTNIWKNPGAYRHISLDDVAPSLGDLRWTVDRPDDLYFVRWVYDQLPWGFGWQEVLGLRDAWARHVRDNYRDCSLLLPPGIAGITPMERLRAMIEMRFGK